MYECSLFFFGIVEVVRKLVVNGYCFFLALWKLSKLSRRVVLVEPYQFYS